MREKMKKKFLVDEIVNFCFKYGLIANTTNVDYLRNNIEEQLNDVVFVENLINAIFIRGKQYKILRSKKVMNIIMELEKIRLQLEDNRS